MIRSLIITLILTLGLSATIPHAEAKRLQFNVNAGTEIPDEGTDREGENAFYLQIKMSTFASLARLQSSLTALFGSGYLQGEFAIGPSIYFLTPLVGKKAQAHPFLLVEGVIGVGALDETSQFDFGWAAGVGVDLRFWEKSGLTIGVQKHGQSSDSLRYYLGFYAFRN